jgi:hypothetical protein
VKDIVSYFRRFRDLFCGAQPEEILKFQPPKRGWVRGFYIGVGVLAVIFAIMIIVSHFFGAVLAGFIMGIILLIIGIEIIVAGIGGRETHLRPPGFKRKIE